MGPYDLPHLGGTDEFVRRASKLPEHRGRSTDPGAEPDQSKWRTDIFFQSAETASHRPASTIRQRSGRIRAACVAYNGRCQSQAVTPAR